MKIFFILLIIAMQFACSIDYSVTETPRKKELTKEEIKSNLKGDDFKKKIEGREQIEKLPIDERIELLRELSSDKDPATRIIAVEELKKIDKPEAFDILKNIAENDPDETVQELAREYMKKKEGKN